MLNRRSLSQRIQDRKRNEAGMAIIEIIPILIIIVILFNYSLGFFGVVHTGVLNSIAARNYTFQTLNNRSDVMYFRDTPGSEKSFYQKHGMRMHMIVSDNAPNTTKIFTATERRFDFLQKNEEIGTPDLHNNKIYSVIDGKRYQDDGVNPVWIRSQYGICLNSVCGPP